VSWSEVGIIQLDANLSDNDYLGSGNDVTGTVDQVGRFIPADFKQTVDKDGMFEAVHGSFTYTGQQFGYAVGSEPALTITARNDGGSTTENYTGGFAKLVAGDVARTAPSQDDSQNGDDGDPLPVCGVPDTCGPLNTGTRTDNGDGTLTYDFAAPVANDPNDPTQPGSGVDSYTYERNIDRDGDNRNDARLGPFTTDLTITIDDITDSDGVTATTLNDVTPTGVEIRFGRLLVENAVGSEIAPIDQPVRAEFWTGDTWQVNGADSATALTLGGSGNEVQLENKAGNTEPGDSDIVVDTTFSEDSDDDRDEPGETKIDNAGPVSLNSGQTTLTFLAPESGNTGWVNTTALLGSQDHPYLRTDPDDDGDYTDPTGRVTFGIYRGNSNWIHLRRVR